MQNAKVIANVINAHSFEFQINFTNHPVKNPIDMETGRIDAHANKVISFNLIVKSYYGSRYSRQPPATGIRSRLFILILAGVADLFSEPVSQIFWQNQVLK